MRRVAFVLVAALFGCSGATPQASCPDGLTACDGRCVDQRTDPDHCGLCGEVCDDGRTCSAGRCSTACELALDTVTADEWGHGWDGVDREAATYADATAQCASLGARLPTATELFRIRQGNSAGSGSAAPGSESLWSTTVEDPTHQAAVRLADGRVSLSATTAQLGYRCMCPAPLPPVFAGARCHGPARSPCFTLGKRNIDNYDRPPLRRAAAIAECAGEHAHLADVPTLVEAILDGLVGSGAVVQTADRASYYRSTALVWTVARWTARTNELSLTALDIAAPFRCAGWSVETAGLRADTTDRPAAAWGATHDACVVAGGHLATDAELTELIRGGLPNGSGAPLWTADQTGLGSGEFLAASLLWIGTAPRFLVRYPDSATWLYKTNVGGARSRCVYYPTDPTVTEPTACAGRCFSLVLGATDAASPTMWLDVSDRPAATFEVAIETCQQLGGRLSSERDLIEAIRGGLPNGSGLYLWTTETGEGIHGLTYFQPLPHVVRFTGTQPTYGDLYAAAALDMTWSLPSTPRPYRCMWTNELR